MGNYFLNTQYVCLYTPRGHVDRIEHIYWRNLASQTMDIVYRTMSSQANLIVRRYGYARINWLDSVVGLLSYNESLIYECLSGYIRIVTFFLYLCPWLTWAGHGWVPCKADMTHGHILGSCTPGSTSCVKVYKGRVRVSSSKVRSTKVRWSQVRSSQCKLKVRSSQVSSSQEK